MSSRIKGEHLHLLSVSQIYLYCQGCISFICWSTVTVILYIPVPAASYHKQKAALSPHTHTVEWWIIVMHEFFWWHCHGLSNFLTSALEALMFLLVKNAGWAHASLWDLYFVECEDIKSKYSSIGLLIHEALEYTELKKTFRIDSYFWFINAIYSIWSWSIF